MEKENGKGVKEEKIRSSELFECISQFTERIYSYNGIRRLYDGELEKIERQINILTLIGWL